MSRDDYSEIVLDHFMYPRCMGLIDYINGKGAYGDPKCGDYIEVYIYVEDEIIKDIGFLVFGCVGAIACGSMTMVLAKRKTLKEALKITEEDIIEALDGLPEDKKHCSNLGAQALRNAINDYFNEEKN